MQASIEKSLAAILDGAYARALVAREAVEHRLASIPRQEAVVRQWRENLPAMAATHYPGYDVSSYPVETRMRKEFATLERYQAELPERLDRYATALQTIDRTIEEILGLIKRASPSGPTVPWPPLSKPLKDDPWPSGWPPRPSRCECAGSNEMAYVFDSGRSLSPPRPPSPTTFFLDIAGHVIELGSHYEEGASSFAIALEEYLNGATSSRWPALIEAIRCGIRWSQLDSYLAECKQPWLPEDFVGEMFGLRGTLERRDDLADVMAQISPDAGRWYLTTQPMRYLVQMLDNLNHDILEELMAVGLVRWGADMSPKELLRELPFSEVKLLFLLGGLSAPKGFDVAVARYEELVSAHGEDYLRQRIRSFVDPSEVIEVREIDGWHREERLGPRARANVLVSTLVLLSEGNRGALQVIDWNG
jgi:hypothetical protein